jgi:hypothetical protein
MAERGGKREGAGRKPVADEKKVTALIVEAIKEYHNVDNDDDAKKHFITTLYEHTRGQIFLAEHLFGKAPQEVKQTNLNIDATDLTDEEVLRIKTALENAY